MTKKLRRKTWREYAGCAIRGTVKIPTVNIESSTHLERAAWLTSMVESGGVYGTVQNYDGAGMTAGVHQAIAVYPKQLVEEDDIPANDQGPLWELLLRIQQAADGHQDGGFTKLVIDFTEDLLEIGWYISPGAVLCYNATGEIVNGRHIRYQLSGDQDGHMPTKGPGRERAEWWLDGFHELFSHPATFKVQQEYGEEHFCKGAKRKFKGSSIAPLLNRTIQKAFYGNCDLSGVQLNDLGPSLDLALCMYWNYSVNAPSKAIRCITQTAEAFYSTQQPNPKEVAIDLVKRLGNNKYGRWDDDLVNGRYQRTRKYAMKVWPKKLFQGKGAVMPKDLED